MKKIEAIIKPHVLDKVRTVLNQAGVEGMTIYEVRGYGRQKGRSELYRGAEYTVDYLPKLKLETVVPDELEDKVIEVIAEAADSGKIGDGKIFTYEVGKAMRIRTRETGSAAI